MPGLESLPTPLRIVGRSLRALSYLFGVGIGLGDLLFTEALIGSAELTVGGFVVIAAWSSACIGLGVVGVVSVIAHRWRWEWVVSFWLAAVLLMLRGFDLTVFAIRTSAWAVNARSA